MLCNSLFYSEVESVHLRRNLALTMRNVYIRDAYWEIRTPFGKMRTLFFRPKAWDFLRGLLGDTPGYWRKHERGAGLVQGLQQSVHLTNS